MVQSKMEKISKKDSFRSGKDGIRNIVNLRVIESILAHSTEDAPWVSGKKIVKNVQRCFDIGVRPDFVPKYVHHSLEQLVQRSFVHKKKSSYIVTEKGFKQYELSRNFILQLVDFILQKHNPIIITNTLMILFFISHIDNLLYFCRIFVRHTSNS